MTRQSRDHNLFPDNEIHIGQPMPTKMFVVAEKRLIDSGWHSNNKFKFRLYASQGATQLLNEASETVWLSQEEAVD